MCYSDRTFDFESLLIVSDLLALFIFKSLAYYVVIILQCTGRINFNSLTFSYIFHVLIIQSNFYFYNCLIELSRDVEKNPGSNSKPNQSISVCHWNLNSIAAHKFLKIQSLIAYHCIHYFDIIFSETYLNSTFHLRTRIWIYYRLIGSDHPSNDNQRGVWYLCLF